MKPLHLTVVLFCSFLILLVSRPLEHERQAEESSVVIEDIDRTHFRVQMEIIDAKDREIADILWFQEAARAALERNVSRFNVLEQRTTDELAEGVVELETDAMKAEYDAQEILSLGLTEEVE